MSFRRPSILNEVIPASIAAVHVLEGQQVPVLDNQFAALVSEAV